MKNYTTEKLQEQLSQVNWFNVIEHDDINVAWNNFKTILTEIIDRLAPIKEMRLKQRSEPWLESEIIDLIRTRDRLLYDFRKGGLTEKFEEYKKVRNKVQLKIKHAKSNYYYTKTHELKHKPKKLWQTLKDIGTSKTTSTKEANLGLKIKDEITFDKEKVGQAFNTYFTSIASTLVSKLPPCTGLFGKEFVTDHYQNKRGCQK